MRTEAGRDPHDRGLQDLVGELSTRSETFRRLWAAHNVRTHGAGTKRFHHPVVGELTLAYEELAITAEPGLVLHGLHRRARLALRRTPPPARLLGGTGAGARPTDHPHEHVEGTRCRSPAAPSTPPRARPTGSPATSTSTPSPPRRHRRGSTANLVHFMPGARTHWHRHPLSQTVFVTEGVGLCQRRGGPVEVIRPGDRVLFEADEEHWHGAAPNRLMVHLAINEADDQHDVVHWLEPVTDEEYAAAPARD